jgi:hypothetical protein
VPLFEIKTPDGRVIRQSHASSDVAKRTLAAGYVIVNEVFGQSADGTGGFTKPIDGPSVLALALAAYGPELELWLESWMRRRADRIIADGASP